VKILLRTVLNQVRRLHQERLLEARIRLAQDRIARFSRPYKLNVGSGKLRFEGWVNLDLAVIPGITDIQWDATQPFPFSDGSCAVIYNEHFLEHITVPQAISFLQECRRLLIPGGTLRIAMPSLEDILHHYYSETWKEQDWLTWEEHQGIQTRAEMVNVSMRWWGHQWIYDREELHRRLKEAGFTHILDAEWGRSDHPELCSRETRQESRLICEASCSI
jgi:predicted SAM-dependent methyltransferase